MNSPPPSRKRRIRAALIAYLTVWAVLTHWPNPGPLPPIPGGDKTIHMIGYLIAGILLMAVPGPPWRPRHLLYSAGLMAFAACDEATQALVNRGPSIHDFAADCLGAAIAAGLALTFWMSRKPCCSNNLP